MCLSGDPHVLGLGWGRGLGKECEAEGSLARPLGGCKTHRTRDELTCRAASQKPKNAL